MQGREHGWEGTREDFGYANSPAWQRRQYVLPLATEKDPGLQAVQALDRAPE